MVVDAQVAIVVQINGKVRAKLTVAKDTPKDEMTALAKENDNVKRYLDGATVLKEIVVPNKLVSFVVK